jgi:hypothetical protein
MPKTSKQVQTPSFSHLPSSFRDPAGYIFLDEKQRLHRMITPSGVDDFLLTKNSGLLAALHSEGLLVAHKERAEERSGSIILTPRKIPYITYPFEWSFTMLKDAALLTLRIQKLALGHGMSLKDASAYNVQFANGSPVFIDTLSFEKYIENEPWKAYGQFCRHFFAPLLLMSTVDIRLSQMLREHLDGIPLDLATKLLPSSKKLKPSIFLHIVMHARAQNKKKHVHESSTAKLPKRNLLALLDSLERSIKKLQPKNDDTEWRDYYENTNYSRQSAKKKQEILLDLTAKIPRLDSVLDLGGNDGHYSRVFSDRGITTVCADIDPFAVEYNYTRERAKAGSAMLPLLVDLTNPGGALGWGNEERDAISNRLASKLVLSLALIHHLAISNNVPFAMIARYLSGLGEYLIIEFVPKKDSQVRKLLSTREDVFDNYDEANFEQAFSLYYKLREKRPIPHTSRTLYLFKVRHASKEKSNGKEGEASNL